MVVIVLGIYAAMIIGVLLWVALLGMRFRGSLTDEPLPERLPLVSTIVPARNEERNIGRCAQGLMRQDYSSLELIFVDDDSTDATPHILASVAARDPRIKIVHTQGKPHDWNGKQWACHSGAQAATGDWLCFMDADTYAEPDLIRRTLAYAEAHKIDMLSLQPWFEMRGLWERIVLPFYASLVLVFPPHRINDPDDDLAVANGQFILIRCEAYQAIGGHEAVRQRMMDDFSLAEITKKAGYRLAMVDGNEVMRVRLYTNLREIRGGALKAAVELTGGWLKSTLALGGNFVVNVLPVIVLIAAILAGHTQAILIMGATVAFQVLFFAGIRLAGQFRAPPWSSVTYPIGGIITTAILIDGMVRLASGGEIKWKGRDLLGRPDLEIELPLEKLPVRRKDGG